MHWLLLIIAAIFEIGWPLGFKLSSTQPERFWTWITFAIARVLLSVVRCLTTCLNEVVQRHSV